jgi:hypothetical protein
MVLELLSLGEWARAAGWLATAQRLLDQGNHDCPERGLLQVLFARAFLKEQNEMAAYDAASQAAALGDRFNDPELKVFGRLSQALVHARRGEADAAAALFDEVMVAVTNGSVSPIGAGVVYCAVIGGCHEILDVGRAREWTAALATWCNAQSDLVAYRGQCRVHRAETMRLCGAWTDAMAEARQAFSGPSRTPGRLDNFDTVAPPVRDYATGAAFCG